jgi:hypothetical protein
MNWNEKLIIYEIVRKYKLVHPAYMTLYFLYG